MDPDEQRIAAAVAGDAAALEAVVREHEATVRARLQIAPKWSRSIDVDDVMQVTYLEMFLRIRSLQSATVSSFVAWFTRVAQNNLADAIRMLSSARRPDANARVTQGAGGESARTLLLQVAGGDTTAGSRAVVAEEIERMRRAIARMPASYRRVIELVDLEERPVAEVAAELERSVGAVHMLRSRAHDRLGELLRGDG